MTLFPPPPLKESLIEDRLKCLNETHDRLSVPLDLFQAFFYSALGFAGVDRLITLVQTHNINAVIGSAAVVAVAFLSLWLTFRYVMLLGDLVILLLARTLSESQINKPRLAKTIIALFFLVAVIFNLAFALNAKCALLNECPNSLSSEGIKK